MVAFKLDYRRVRTCQCESSLCDGHAPGSCERPVDCNIVMDFVTDTCANCAANMCCTDGEDFIHITPDHTIN